MPLLSVFPPLRISVCKLLVSGSLHFAIYLKQPGEAKDLRVREGEWVGKKERRAGGKKVKACRGGGKERVSAKEPISYIEPTSPTTDQGARGPWVPDC